MVEYDPPLKTGEQLVYLVARSCHDGECCVPLAILRSFEDAETFCQKRKETVYIVKLAMEQP